jgi:hypothetical protein
METIAPTVERLRHGYGHDAPERSRTANRVAYRTLSAFEAMHRKGQIYDCHLMAAVKLEGHYRGARGAKVGNGEGSSAGEHLECPEIYHWQMLAEAWHQVRPREEQALTMLIEGKGNVEYVGRLLSIHKDRGRAGAIGRELVTGGLECLATYWGFRQHREP